MSWALSGRNAQLISMLIEARAVAVGTWMYVSQEKNFSLSLVSYRWNFVCSVQQFSFVSSCRLGLVTSSNKDYV
jgi:hypothetical protein